MKKKIQIKKNLFQELKEKRLFFLQILSEKEKKRTFSFCEEISSIFNWKNFSLRNALHVFSSLKTERTFFFTYDEEFLFACFWQIEYEIFRLKFCLTFWQFSVGKKKRNNLYKWSVDKLKPNYWGNFQKSPTWKHLIHHAASSYRKFFLCFFLFCWFLK